MALAALLGALLSGRLGYGPYDLSDTVHYLWVAEQVARGAWPYSGFGFEYPPLALVFMLAPGVHATLAGYEHWFAAEMMAVCAATAVVTAAVAVRLWGGLGRPLAAAAAFAVATWAAGGIVINRFDPAVGLVVVLAVLALVYRRYALAGVAVGLGFGLKAVPVVLLPLVLLTARTRRAVLGAAAAAVLAAVIPFLPFLVHAPHGFSATLAYQQGRSLQIESVAASPYLLAQVLRPGAVHVIVPPGGSLAIGAPGTGLISGLAPVTMLILLTLVYAFVWRARAVVRDDPEWVPPAALAVLLAALCGNKVLSPQHLLWVLPLVALGLVAKRSLHRAVALLVLVAVALTQVEFPAMYHRVQALDALPLLVIAARNALLVAALVVALVALWRIRPASAR